MVNTQIYSATYSNVPVFELVTSEGPIMRRKLDSWINATHILKIAKFPKAKRTRILEKDVQTGVHEKVQGGYGKYQGTYVPLELGAEIAKNFDVFDVLRPIFEFEYIEGKSETPPPAPKHSHASASNVARRQTSLALPARKAKSMTAAPGEPPKKRGRPKRNLDSKPTLGHSDTTPIDASGPSFGTFKESITQSQSKPSLNRQDTEQDALMIMSSNLKMKDEDLELVESGDEDIQEESQDLISSKELFGTPRNFYDKSTALTHSNNNDPYGLIQYQQQLSQASNNMNKDDLIYAEYFSNLLVFFLDDTKIRMNELPEKILLPPQPISKIDINHPIDNDGNTIFHWACSMANISIIEFLIATFDIKSSIRNENGETPLMFLVKFSNAYQMKNFPNLLDLLLDSILLVDNSGKTVLHHIALMENKNKEKYSRYYAETLITRIVELQESISDDKDILQKFLNHQDNNGNTAFHIVAYNLNKKCIKVFISYHKFIDFSLKNLVFYTVEDYLASHNYVLRLDQDNLVEEEEEETEFPSKFQSTQSFESQLHHSKMAINLQNSTSNLITEKLTELAYTIDRELSEKDEKILSFLKVLKQVNYQKLQSQKEILAYFKLDYLMEDAEESYKNSNPHDIVIDQTKDKMIQEEMQRLINDVTFQHLREKEELNKSLRRYKTFHENIMLKKLKQLEAHYYDENVNHTDRFGLAVELEKMIQKRSHLRDSLYTKQLEVPLSTNEFKENKCDSKSIVANYPNDDRLNKYCKLISLCCGMDFNDVEKSIDLIEQSLSKSNK